MRSFRHTVDIAASPDEVWAVLGNLTAVGNLKDLVEQR
jgi:hypothetical protein